MWLPARSRVKIRGGGEGSKGLGPRLRRVPRLGQDLASTGQVGHPLECRKWRDLGCTEEWLESGQAQRQGLNQTPQSCVLPRQGVARATEAGS